MIMIRGNIEARIQAKIIEREEVRDQILRLDKEIEVIKEKQKMLLSKESDLCYELEELNEELNQ